MTDDELDELIVTRLRHIGAQAGRSTTNTATQAPGDLAVFFNEPEDRVQARIRVLAEEGEIKESTAAPDRWMIV